MCTVSYLPISSDQFILTSNRDEAPSRATQKVVQQALGNGTGLFFPQDPRSGGTWICLSDKGRLVCLLNGAFEKHAHRPPYRRSRGLLVLDVFEYASLDDFFQNYELEGIEPFTMVVVEQQELFEFRWDEQKRHLKKLDARQAHIWSSSTLYDATFRAKRKALFEEWLEEQLSYQMSGILKFHEGGGTGDPDNDFVMNRKNIVRTVSITSIEKNKKAFHFVHKDLLKEDLIQYTFDISKTQTIATN